MCTTCSECVADMYIVVKTHLCNIHTHPCTSAHNTSKVYVTLTAKTCTYIYTYAHMYTHAYAHKNTRACMTATAPRNEVIFPAILAGFFSCCATIRCLTQIYSLYKHVPLASFCFVLVNHVLVTRQHESGDVYTFFACSDPFSLYYIGHRGPPTTHYLAKNLDGA